MSTREIVTFQIGHYSNFVGSHWWNLQESSFVYEPQVYSESPKEVNHDVLYREGKTIKGEVTYTPRLVAFDLSHSLGSLKREGILYDVGNEDDIKWTGDVTLHQAQAVKKNRFLEELDQEGFQDNEDNEDNGQQNKNETDVISEDAENSNPSSSSTENQKVFGHSIYRLDDDVKVWSDFLRTCLHPKSLSILQDHQHANPEQPFNIFGIGQKSLDSVETWDRVEDKIRYFTEECDNLQGFNVMFDSHNAFGGVASTVLTYLGDEFPNKANMCFSLTPACPSDQTAQERASRILNSALSLHSISQFSSLYIPLSLASSLWKSVGPPISLPTLAYKASLDYHSSAVIAAAIDTATLPFRKETDAIRMYDVTSTFSSRNRKVCALNASLPFPSRVGKSFAQSLVDLGEEDPWVSLTPHVKCVKSPDFNSCVARGMPKISDRRDADHHTHHPLASCSSLEDVLRLYLTETYPQSLNAGCIMKKAMKLDASYPHIFNPSVNYQGFLSDTSRSKDCGVESVPVMTSLQSTSEVFPYLDSLVGTVSRFNISKHHSFIEAGLNNDDFIEAMQDLKDLTEKYKESSW